MKAIPPYRMSQINFYIFIFYYIKFSINYFYTYILCYSVVARYLCIEQFNLFSYENEYYIKIVG